MAPVSPNGTWLIFFNSGLNGSRFAGWPVIDSAPIVRPWNAPSVATIRFRPVNRESLIAASLASAPELQKKTRALESPTIDFKLAARSIAG